MSHTPHQWQSEAAEVYQRLGGVFCGMEPGAGKSWACALIAAQCVRPLVVAPASVLPQTRAMFDSYGVSGVEFRSYTWLTRAAHADYLERFAPTDIIMDEFHECRRIATNSATRRIERYLIAHPAVRVGVFSGSLVTDRLQDFSHGLTWALRRRAPVPPTRAGVEMLAERFAADPAAWAEFQRRLASTEGVFLDSGGVGRYTGRVVVRVIRREPALTLPDTWELPDGYLLTSPAQAAEVSRLMAWGAWMRVTPRPSERYLAARRAWSHTVRGVIGTGAADTEFQVRALRPEAFAAYVDAEDAEPRGAEEAVWDGTAMKELYFWLLPRVKNTGTPTIVWADRRPLQGAAADLLNCPLHRERGLDADGVRLDETRAPLVVASIEACHQGMNAQAFNHNLVLEPPSDPEVWRQLIGRTARQGQMSPVVTVDIVVNCPASECALRTVIARAKLSGKPNPILQLDGVDW